MLLFVKLRKICQLCSSRHLLVKIATYYFRKKQTQNTCKIFNSYNEAFKRNYKSC